MSDKVGFDPELKCYLLFISHYFQMKETHFLMSTLAPLPAKKKELWKDMVSRGKKTRWKHVHTVYE